MSVDQKILHWLETELFEGRIALGQNLPDDRRIADILKTGHSSTREAIKRLETMGVLRLYEGKRKTIIPQLVSNPAQAVTPALRLHMAQAQHPTRDLIQTWTLLETWSVAHADRTSPAMAELENLLDAMQAENIFPQDFHELEASFHVTLARLAGNHVVSGMMTALHDSIYEYLLSLLGRVPLWSATATRLRAEHQAIVDALKSGDNELAQQLVASSIEAQYEEAGIELDESTEVANSLPGTVAALAPLEDESDDDLVPDKWEGSVAPDLISALENIGTPASYSSTAPSSSVAPAVEDDARAADSGEEGVDVVATESVSEPQPADNAPEQPSATWSDPQKIKASLYGDYMASPEYVPFSERNVLRAPEKQGAVSRKRRGTVSAPVHATVIKPIDRSGYLPGATAGRPVSQPQEEENSSISAVQEKEQSRPASADRDVLRATPRRPEPEEPQNPSEAEEQEQTEAKSKFFGKWFHRKGNTALDAEAHELARQQRLAALTSGESYGSDEASETEPETEDDGYQLEEEELTEKKPQETQSSLPSGYVLADEYREPEIIDETAKYNLPKKSAKNNHVQKQGTGQKAHSINKNKNKKKKKKR